MFLLFLSRITIFNFYFAIYFLIFMKSSVKRLRVHNMSALYKFIIIVVIIIIIIIII